MKENGKKLGSWKGTLHHLLGSWAGALTVFAVGGVMAAEPMNAPAAAAEKAPRKPSAQKVLEGQIAALPEAQRMRILNLLNQGSAKELAALPGVAGVRSSAIQEARPFSSLQDVLRASGVGTATLTQILEHESSTATQATMGSGS